MATNEVPKYTPVKLTGLQAWRYWQYLNQTAPRGRFEDKCLATLDATLRNVLEMKTDLDGRSTGQIFPEARIVNLDSNDVYALKEVFAQAIVGSQQRAPISYMERRDLEQVAAQIGKRFVTALEATMPKTETVPSDFDLSGDEPLPAAAESK